MLIAASVLLPVLFTISIGFLIERFRQMDTRTLSTISIYVLTPSLVFYSLLTTQLTHRDIFQLILFLPLLTFGLWGVTRLSLGLRREPPEEEGPAMLCTLFMNAGNYGIPMSRSAFGEAGVEHGVVWVIVQNSLLFPLATYYAARDQHGSLNAIKAVFKLPAIWAVFLAGLLRLMNVTLPDGILEPIRSIGYAMIPIAQILLGVQLAKTMKEAHHARVDRIAWAVGIRLIAAPLLAVPIAAALGAEGLTYKVLVLLAGTPTAVNISILAMEFDARPHFVASVVFFSTVFSFLTLSVTLSLLGVGAR
ncbi:MAG: AEC family transporter [Armatimonadetes bacterium]|nr:AEC family transporter [Armatimonadota bacterium]